MSRRAYARSIGGDALRLRTEKPWFEPFDSVEDLRGGHLESLSDPEEPPQRRRADPAFELTDVGAAAVDLESELFLRKAVFLP